MASKIINAVQTRLKLEEATSAKDDVTPGANERKGREKKGNPSSRPSIDRRDVSYSRPPLFLRPPSIYPWHSLL